MKQPSKLKLRTANLAFRSCPGYILFEAIIAVTVFSLAIVGLMRVLGTSLDSANLFARDTAIRYGLPSILTEARHQELENMSLEQTDEALGVVYRTEVEPLPFRAGAEPRCAISTSCGPRRRRATAGDEQEVAQIWIYRKEGDGNAE